MAQPSCQSDTTTAITKNLTGGNVMIGSTEYSLFELQHQGIRIDSHETRTEQSMSPHIFPQRVKLMRLNLPDHLGRAVPKAMNRSPSEDISAVVLHGL
jgi:hypothetical protein